MKTFEEWFGDVDKYIQMMMGCSVEDLPDALHRDAFESGVSAYVWAEQLAGDMDE